MENESIPRTPVLHTTEVPGMSSHRDTERGFQRPGADIHTASCPRGNASCGTGAGVWETNPRPSEPGAAADALRQCRLRLDGALRPRDHTFCVLSSQPQVRTNR